jgi:hypothetical protein
MAKPNDFSVFLGVKNKIKKYKKQEKNPKTKTKPKQECQNRLRSPMAEGE